MNEMRSQAEEDHSVRLELHDQVNTLVIRIKTLRRQLEEAVSLCRMSLFCLFCIIIIILLFLFCNRKPFIAT